MTGIIDYGAGNLHSVQKALESLGVDSCLVQSAEATAKYDRLILPGVGAFGEAMARLEEMGLVGAIREYVAGGRPFLGICLGLQLLCEESEESPGVKGIGILQANVCRFQKGLKVPHLGWNQVACPVRRTLFHGISEGAFFYFAHSYHLEIAPAQQGIVAATCDYGKNFVAAIERDNLLAVQFHPEKSQQNGITMLENFIKM